MGTVVFPDACAKFFLTASTEARAQRRYKQLLDKGIDAIFPPFCGSSMSAISAIAVAQFLRCSLPAMQS